MKNIFKIFIAIFIISLPQITVALENKISECSKITDNDKRLECYDSIYSEINKKNDDTKITAEDKPKEEDKDGNIAEALGWIKNEDESKLDNSKTLMYDRFSSNMLSNSYGKEGPAALVVRCKNNQTESYIAWNSYLGIEPVKVSYRIDTDPIKRVTCDISSDHTAFFIRKPIAFLKELIGKKELIVQVRPYQSGPQEAEFSLEGIDKVVQDISEACKWNKTQKSK